MCHRISIKYFAVHLDDFFYRLLFLNNAYCDIQFQENTFFLLEFIECPVDALVKLDVHKVFNLALIHSKLLFPSYTRGTDKNF